MATFVQTWKRVWCPRCRGRQTVGMLWWKRLCPECGGGYVGIDWAEGGDVAAFQIESVSARGAIDGRAEGGRTEVVERLETLRHQVVVRWVLALVAVANMLVVLLEAGWVWPS